VRAFQRTAAGLLAGLICGACGPDTASASASAAEGAQALRRQLVCDVDVPKGHPYVRFTPDIWFKAGHTYRMEIVFNGVRQKLESHTFATTVHSHAPGGLSMRGPWKGRGKYAWRVRDGKWLAQCGPLTL
jgi:hypothetical protein